MPVVPIEENHVGIADPTMTPLRTPDLAGTGLDAVGTGLQKVGQAGEQYADMQNQIQTTADHLTARTLAVNGGAQMSSMYQDYEGLSGKDAADQGPAVQAKMTALNAQLLASAGNDRTRAYATPLLQEQLTSALNKVADHSRTQQKVWANGTYNSGLTLAIQQAAAVGPDPDKQALPLAQARENLAALGHLNGWDDETAKLHDLEMTSSVHASVLGNILAQPNASIDTAQAYYNAHAGEMTMAARNTFLKDLQKPLDARQATADVNEAKSGKPPEHSANVAAGTYQPPIVGTVTSKFGDARPGGKTHDGVDIAGAMGSAVHPVAGGVVIAPLADADGDSGINAAVRHPDGHVSTYSHLGNLSVKPGDVVDGTSVIGTVGMTGHTTGPHVHLVIRDADGTKVDPQSLMGGAATGGQVVGDPSTPRKWDVATVLSRIDAHDDWSPERRDRAKAEAVRSMGQDDAAMQQGFTQAKQDAAGWAADWALKHDNTYPPPNLIPTAITSRMEPGQRAEFQLQIAKSRDGDSDKATADARSMKYTDLLLQAYTDKPGFANMDLTKHMGELSVAQYNELRVKKAEISASLAKPQPWDPYTDSEKALNTYRNFNADALPSPGRLALPGAAATFAAQKAAMLESIRTQAQADSQKNGRPPTSTEWQGYAKNAAGTIPLTTHSWIGTTSVAATPIRNLTVDEIPNQDRTDIVNAAKARNQTLTDGDIVNAYIARRGHK